jgi:hypothetical protein
VPTSTAQTAQESNKQGEQPPLAPLNNLLPTMQREQKVNYGPYAEEGIHGYGGERIYIFSYIQMSFRLRSHTIPRVREWKSKNKKRGGEKGNKNPLNNEGGGS